MAYALSVELATMYLSVEAGLVSGAAVVHAPGCGNRGPRGDCILVNDLIAIANAELCAHGSTPAGSPYRDRQECLKRAIERVNGDANFLQKQPCAGTTTASPAKR
jgi:hypothetical protein